MSNDDLRLHQAMWAALLQARAGLEEIPECAALLGGPQPGRGAMQIWRSTEAAVAALTRAGCIISARSEILEHWRRALGICWSLTRSSAHLVRLYCPRPLSGADLDDVVADATLALLEGAKRWDPGRASWPTWSRRVLVYFLAHRYSTPIPEVALTPADWARHQALRRAQRAFIAAGADYCMRDLADATGLRLDDVHRLLCPPRAVALSDPQIEPLDAVPPPAAMELREKLTALMEGVAALPEPGRSIVRRHFGLSEGEPVSLPVIARDLGLAPEDVRRECRRAMNALARHLRASDVDV